jgi:hypothetical protein
MNHQLSTLAEEEEGKMAVPAGPAVGTPLRPRPRNEVELRLTRVQLISSVFVLQGCDNTGKDWLLMLSEEFCPRRRPAVGETVRIVPPWSVIRVPGENKMVHVGITALDMDKEREGLQQDGVSMGILLILNLYELHLCFAVLTLIPNKIF